MPVKVAASLPSLLVEEHEQKAQNTRRLLQWAEMDHVVHVKRRH
jgi:hypothetical protein